ncbi:hypothetical protein DY000_02006667 [Brassica cretica]|uniref:Uncharacterized protein n=1 Tax=Brassica cretica TaxID=69181 RepID=A0ABQ7C9V8_BRACR|nr:hypothetical protein DY000_02006667 [Brassica cretica]
MVRGNVPVGLKTLRQAFHGQDRSSSQLDVLFGFRADGPGQGQWRAVRSGHEAMGCWVLVQGRGAKSRVLGEWCWLMSDPKPSRFRRMAASGRGVQSLTD